MEKFEFILPNDKKRFYNWFAVFLYLINGVAICVLLTRVSYYSLSQNIFGWIPFVISALGLLLVMSGKEFRNRKPTMVIISLCIIGYWILFEQWRAAGLMAVLSLLFFIAQRELKIIVQQDNVIYPSFPKKIISWNELSNILLKDGLLTIDLKNNIIYQHYPEKTIKPVNEKEFNEFCQAMLNPKP